MQLFIGGACAGKRAAVTARFPTACWYRLEGAQALCNSQHSLIAHTPLVITGVLDWLAGVSVEADGNALRQQWRSDLERLCQRASVLNATLIIIANDVGRGIVPIQPAQRRLRDINGWFTQDVAAQAKQVWYVRHGLVKPLK